jgi:hypothetical protein
MTNVSETINALLAELQANRDNELSMAGEVLGQYVTDHNDNAAYRAIDRQVNKLAKAWDAMIKLMEQTAAKAEKIETSCENFYGE